MHDSTHINSAHETPIGETTVLVTGARGQVGRGVIERLHAAGHRVRAASSKPTEIATPTGEPAVELTLSRPKTFAAALHGVTGVFLYCEPEGIDQFLRTAESAGVEHIILLSSSAAATETLDDPIARTHLLTERALADSPITATVLRPGAFAGNSAAWSHSIRTGAPVPLPYPEASIAPVHPLDLADLAVAALTGHGALTGTTQTITGPEALTFREQIAILGGLLGREIPIQEITRAQAQEQWGGYMTADILARLLDLWAEASTWPAVIEQTTQSLLGTPARTFGQWARENLAMFRGPQG